MTRGSYGRGGEQDDNDGDVEGEGVEDDDAAPGPTKADLEREMAEVKDLERKRKALESRVMGFESDLRGLA